MDSYLITNVRVFDRTGSAPFAADVTVESHRITAVAESPRTPGASVIDGAGATLLPGLIEPHAHLSFADMTAADLTRLPPEEHMLATVRNARTMLESGYTSALSGASAKPRLDVVLRRE